MQLPSIFSNGMVLTKNAKIWGKAAPNETVTVNFLAKTYTTTADFNGNFELLVTAENYGGPHSLTINSIVITDVYVGKVWLCSGQSNMEQPISRTFSLLKDFVKEDARIRAFQAVSGCSFEPLFNVDSAWHTATGGFLQNIFAVPYFFARELLKEQKEQNVPIGLINVAAGGSPIEAWLPEDIIKTFPDLYQKMLPYKDVNHIKQQETEDNNRIQQWHNELRQKDAGLQENWQNPSYDDSAWQTRMLLDTSNLPNHGAIWYRKELFFTEPPTAPIRLNLGRVVDSVKIYVNGVLVNSVDYQYPPCVCSIPEGVLQVGKNIIAVRLVADANNPSFTAGKKYQLQHGNDNTANIADLQGLWRWQVGAKMPRLEPARRLYNIPCSTYNYMLAPVLGYSVDGVIWYQGESNTGAPENYQELFTVFVKHLRHKLGDIPVISTQLANYVDPINITDNMGTPGENWAMLREQQRQCLQISNTAMAVAIDCGEYNDLHPQDKKTVGERLAFCAKKLAYGQNVAYCGPQAKSATITENTLVVTFDNADALWAKNGRPILEIIGENLLTMAYAIPVGDKLIAPLNSKMHKNIAACENLKVRFGWTDCPSVVLYNAYNLPASPFEVVVGG